MATIEMDFDTVKFPDNLEIIINSSLSNGEMSDAELTRLGYRHVGEPAKFEFRHIGPEAKKILMRAVQLANPEGLYYLGVIYTEQLVSGNLRYRYNVIPIGK